MNLALLFSRNTELDKELKSSLSHFSFQTFTEPLSSLFKAPSSSDIIFFDTQLLHEEHLKESDVSQIRKTFPQAALIAVCSDTEVRSAVSMIRKGFDDYITLPITKEEVLLVLDRFNEKIRQKAEVEHLKQQTLSTAFNPLIIDSKSPAMRDAFQQIQSVANTKSTVLLLGETGVGKSVFARWIHNNSFRHTQPFVAVHCGAIPDGLVESELFGHEKGSFTDAVKKKVGKFEIAKHGSIFLDEVGTLSAQTQVKLLRVLQEAVLTRVGGENEITTDVRVIAATNENLEELVESKQFRQDLFYRLNVFPVTIPSLRERLEDLDLFVHHFIQKFNGLFNKEVTEADEDTMGALKEYSWPGNIRELENIIERAFILETSNKLTINSLPVSLQKKNPTSAVVPLNTDLTLAEVRNQSIESVERQYLADLLQKTKGKVNQAAEISGVGLRQFHKLLTKYGIQSKSFKDFD